MSSTTDNNGGSIGWSEIPSLREIDLYSFQGLLKSEVKERYAAGYRNWHHHPERFELDGHAPVRELWHRASLAWREILAPEAAEAVRLGIKGVHGASPAMTADLQGSVGEINASLATADSSDESPSRCLLVVAHNNTNQALIATALGLPCTFFRRLVQNNAAVSSLLLRPGMWPGVPPDVSPRNDCY